MHNIFQFKASFQESLEELAKSTPDTSAERKYLEEQIKEMKAELKLKNDKIDKLEKIVYKKKEAVATQVRLLLSSDYPLLSAIQGIYSNCYLVDICRVEYNNHTTFPLVILMNKHL